MKLKIGRHLLKGALVSLITLYLSGSFVHAQNNNVSNENALEEIIVKGIRNSLNTASEIKRNSSVIVDSIVAEDIGKFPDENVAESLQRITGVTIDRSTLGGEGNSVSIRGLGPDFSRVFINGRTVLNSGASRQVNFSDLPSEVVARLDVYKTPMASLIEGGIGGTIEIKTASPFDNGGGFRAAGSTQGVYSDLAEEWKPRISGQISNTFANETIGVLLGVQYQDRTTRQDTFDVPGWQCVDASLESACRGSLEELPLEQRFFRPRFPRQFLRTLDSERLGVNGAIHWRPSDNLKVEFDAFYSQREDLEQQATQITGTFSNLSTIAPGATINSNNTLTNFQALGADLRTAHRILDTDHDSIVLGLKGEYTSGPWTYSADIAYSESNSDGTNNQAQIFRELDGIWNYDTGSGIPTEDLGAFSDNPLLTTGWTVNNVRDEITFQEQDEINFRIDVERALEGFIDTVQVGVRYTDGGLDQDLFGFFQNIRPRPTTDQFQIDQGVSNVFSSTAELFGFSDFGSSLPGDQNANWVIGSIEQITENFLTEDRLSAPNFPGTYTIDEETQAAYVQLNFSHNGSIPISGNIGVRYVNTDIETTGGANTDFLNLQTGDYDDILPSANIRFDLNEELLLRFAFSQVVSRPSYNDLDPGTSVNVTTFTGSAGNPNLEPFRADQADVSLEWYWGNGNLLSLSGFYKDIESFVQTETVLTTVDPVLAAGVDPASLFAISRPGNGDGADVKGFEISYQQAFDMLPEPFDGLGLVASYTRLSSNARTTNSIVGLEVGLEGLSDNAFNITGYYEKNGIGLRLAYNWRDEFLRVTQGVGGTPEFGNDYGQLDATASYDLNDNITFVFEAKNLTDENFRSFEFLEERLRTFNSFGRRYFVGARARF